MAMTNLILKYQIKGQEDVHVCGAARIKIDGLGGVMIFDTQRGINTRLELRHLQSFSLLPIQIPAGLADTLH
jgi:hypothetical protein